MKPRAQTKTAPLDNRQSIVSWISNRLTNYLKLKEVLPTDEYLYLMECVNRLKQPIDERTPSTREAIHAYRDILASIIDKNVFKVGEERLFAERMWYCKSCHTLFIGPQKAVHSNTWFGESLMENFDFLNDLPTLAIYYDSDRFYPLSVGHFSLAAIYHCIGEFSLEHFYDQLSDMQFYFKHTELARVIGEVIHAYIDRTFI